MKKLMILTTLILAAAASAFAQGTTASPTPKTSKTITKKTVSAPKTAPVDDAGITTCINQKLAKSKMTGDGFQVSVNGGVATFSGSTKVPGHKGGVSGIGKSCGAKSIVNNITIEKTTVPKMPKPTVKTKSTPIAPKTN